MRFLSAIILVVLLVLQTAVRAQNPDSSDASQASLTVPSPGILHGIGFSRYSNFDPDRSFKKARESAETDLAASTITSVILEYYGTSTLPTQLKSEFGISDSIHQINIVALDSARVGDWAVYLISDASNTVEFPGSLIKTALSANWVADNFEPVNIDGYWISTGYFDANEFNPDRSWTLAKQEALKNLSLFLSTVVQSNQREFNNQYRNINYTTSKFLFKHIGVIGRKKAGNKVYVLIVVNEQNVVKIEA
jgi:hypothetical protein